MNNTIPVYIGNNTEIRIRSLNIDIDVYEAIKTILNDFCPRVVSGDVMLLDDYGKFPEETKGIDEYFSEEELEIKKIPFAREPPYVIKA